MEAIEAEEESEAWQEEEDAAEAPIGALASLFASIIPRSTPRKPQPDEDEFEHEPIPEGEDWPEHAEFDELAEAGGLPDDAGLEEPLPEPDLDNPLLARKGKAAGAPPTDREAINHEVNPMQVAPEAFEGEPEAAPPDETPPARRAALESELERQERRCRGHRAHTPEYRERRD